jgi:hypothetical protein
MPCHLPTVAFKKSTLRMNIQNNKILDKNNFQELFT